MTKYLQFVCKDAAGFVTNNQTRAFKDAQELGEFVLCQQNNRRTETVQIILPPLPRAYHPTASFVEGARRESLALMFHSGRG
jgi:hypothetical protein